MTEPKADPIAAVAASPAFAALKRVKRLEISLRWLLDEIQHEHCGACGEYFREQDGKVDEDCGSLHYAVKQAIDTLGGDPSGGPIGDGPKAPEKIP